MVRRIIIGLSITLVGALYFRPSFAEVSSGRLSVADREIIERLTRLEEGQKTLGQKISQLEEGMSRLEEGQRALSQSFIRLEEGQKALSQRIDDMGKRMDDMGKRIDSINESLGGRIDSINESLSGRIDDINKRIDSIQGLMFVLLAGMFAVVGFVIWDRKTALSPVIRKSRQLEETDDLMLKALREYSRNQPELAKALKSLGLL